MFDDNVSRVQSASEEKLEGYVDYMVKNVKSKLLVEYDSRAMDVTKSQQLVTQDRIRRIKQLLKSYGIAEKRIVISGGLVSTQPDQVRRNSVQVSIIR